MSENWPPNGIDQETYLYMKCGFASCVYCRIWFPGAHGADYACPKCLEEERQKDEVRKRALEQAHEAA